ncbi:CubicO group peptidase (beta-lactamase class C family) [Aquimarina sp. EL_43]|uniref:serine hydrolase domain-containing protein n=1 Tax=unclassified Aquimarina TaxID=2627091 RepID=UPI0018CB2C18|nr:MULTISPECIES: serine hydrolase [unclassified Aquimarina]MBG6129919.1 CubicO group peptidase (beta-lactamase class C family) [Aquimarina sp. EL_35]MBG6148699.1 CubicO group peptidase (beta-lactamase class C family) [Aquimarina sp. EL_32]MBG6168927.1 CubicO group peptidase (beta-lactamase class C family) [Aquimarina sp. EL_43]
MKSNCLVLIVCFIVACNTSKSSTPKNSQKNEIENLFFSKVDFKKNKPTPNNYVNSFTLNKDEFLNIHFTLDKPLIESLKLLAPGLSQDQLLNKGNFQFSFLVDGKKVHVENLNKGAGTIDAKTTKLKHMVPLMYPEQIDFWGWFMWLKFMKLSGGQDVLVEGNHSLTIEVRPYLKEETLKVGAILAKGNITIEVAKIAIDESLIPVQKIQPDSGWQLSKDSFDRHKIEALNRKIAEKRFENINGVVVIKENKLLIEEYFNGEDRNSLHNSRSVGKSFASTVLGIAIKENHINSENAFLKDFYKLKSFKNYSSKKDSVTLKSLLTMSSGFLGDDSDYNSLGNEENMYPTDNWVKFSLDLPMQKDKTIGKDFTYFTAGVVILGDIIHKSVPEGLISYADKKLFEPLNITNYKWQYTPQKIGNTAGGIQLRAIDFAKYGQLYKNKGKWNGKQIITEKWVEKSVSKQVSQAYAGIKDGYYGYLFWNKIYTINGKDYPVSFCSGRGGNKIFIFKNIPFVVVITSSAYNNPNAHANADKMMKEYILPAIIEKK